MIEHGVNQENIQEMNRTLLLHLLRERGVCSRVYLAKKSCLRQATVTNIIGDFISWGLVNEVGYLTGSKGRRSVGISIDRDRLGVIGIRLTRHGYSIGIFDLMGNEVQCESVYGDRGYLPKEMMDDIIEEVQILLEQNDSRHILAIGAALPGPYSMKRGRIELMTGIRGWSEIAIKEELESRFGIPVFLEQDANAGALAEYWRDPEAYRNQILVYIADGQGVGAGIISCGELLKGVLGMAGEIGHTSINYKGPRCSCGNYGCLENYCSSTAFTKEINRILADEREYTFADAAELVRKGNSIAIEIFNTCCDNLAAGVVNIINSFNPATIVIDDEMSDIVPEMMLERVVRQVKHRILPEIFDNLKILIGETDNAMLHGAALVAIQDILRHVGCYFPMEES